MESDMISLKRVLMERDNMSAKEAEVEIMWLSHAVKVEGKNPVKVLAGIGLEMDYVKELV